MISLLIKLWTKYKHTHKKGNKENSKELAKEIIKEHSLQDHYDIGEFVDDKMEYKMDKVNGLIDTIQDLDYTVNRGYKGDCDDFSMLAYRLLEELDYEPMIITVIPLKFWKGHVLCLYKVDGEYYFISTDGDSANGSFKDVEEVFDCLGYDRVLGYYIDEREL
jgi:hypothetical protein